MPPAIMHISVGQQPAAKLLDARRCCWHSCPTVHNFPCPARSGWARAGPRLHLPPVGAQGQGGAAAHEGACCGCWAVRIAGRCLPGCWLLERRCVRQKNKLCAAPLADSECPAGGCPDCICPLPYCTPHQRPTGGGCAQPAGGGGLVRDQRRRHRRLQGGVDICTG